MVEQKTRTKAVRSQPPHGYGHAEHVQFSSLPKAVQEYLVKCWNALSPEQQAQHLENVAKHQAA